MKTEKEIATLITAELAILADKLIAKSKKNKAKRNIEQLKFAKMYLDVLPSEETIKKELGLIEKKLKSISVELQLRISQNFKEADLKSKAIKSYIANHDKLYDVKKLKAQYNFLKFILN